MNSEVLQVVTLAAYGVLRTLYGMERNEALAMTRRWAAEFSDAHMLYELDVYDARELDNFVSLKLDEYDESRRLGLDKDRH